MADTNDITLGVGINATDAVAKANELQQQIEEIFKASEGKQSSPAFQQMLAQLASVYDRSKNAVAEVEKIGTKPTAAMDNINHELFVLQENLAKVRKELDDYHSKLNDLANKEQAYVVTDEYKALIDTIRRLQADLNGAKLLMNEFAQSAQSGSENAVRAYNRAKKEAEGLQQQLTILKRVQAGMDESDLSHKSTDEYRDLRDKAKNAAAEVKNLTNQIQKQKDAQQKLIDSGKDKTALDNSANYGKTLNTLNDVNNKTSQLVHKLNQEIPNAANTTHSALQKAFGQSIVDIGNHINQLPQMIERVIDNVARTLPPYMQVIYSVVKFGAKQIIDAYREAFKEVSTTIKNGLTKAANVATTAVKALVKEVAKLAGSAFLSPIKKLGDAISNIGKQANSSAPSLKQIGRAFLQYRLGARSLYRLINKLRTELIKGFADLALVDEPFNAAMSSIISSLEYLRNAFAAAFAPIIQAVAPALSTFINMVAQAVVWLGQLIALLTGQPFKIAVPTVKDYASGTSAGAAAAKKAAKAENDRAKALKKTAKEMRTIAGFDDVEILKAPDDNDSGSGGSGGGGGGGGGGGLAFQTAPISEGLQKFADMLKKIWETADAFDLGVLVSKKLGELLKAFNAAVPNIQKVVTKIAKILASFLAGFFSVYETFVELGKAIGNVVNIVFTGINEFLKEFMERNGFKNLGKDIYLTIMNALNTIDWDTIYSAFALMGIGLAQVLNETITKPELWEAVVNALCNMLTALLLRAANFVNTLDWGEIGTAVAAGINAGIANFPFELVSSTATAFINGIFTAFGNAAANIYWGELGHNIGKSIMDFFDSVKWIENGASLGAFVQGLFDTLSGIVEELDFGKITQDIVGFITGFMDKVNWEEDANTVLKLLNGLLDVFLGVVDEIGWEEILNNIWKYIQNSPEVVKFLDNIWDTIKTIAETKLKFKLASFMTIGGMVVGGILEGMFTPIANGMMWVQTHIVDPIIDWFFNLFGIHSPAETTKPVGEGIINGILEGMLNTLASIGSWINEHIFTPIKNGLLSAFGINGNSANNVKETGTSIIQGIWDGITETLSDPIGWIQEHIATPIKGGLETAFGIAGGVASRIKEIGSAVVNGFKSGAEETAPQVNTSATEINDNMRSSLSAGNWDSIGSNVINKVKSGMDSVKSAITNTAQTIQRSIYTTLQTADWSKIGSFAITTVKAGMESIKERITATAKNIQISVYTTLQTADWAKIGSSAIASVQDGLDNMKSSVVSTAEDIQRSVYDGLNSGTWYDIGNNIINGIWDGLNSGWGWLEDKVWNLARSLYDAACRALGIQSPSKVFAEKVGEMIPAGIGIGITDDEKSATNSVETMAQSLVNSAKNIKLPPIAMGEIIPNGIANRNDNSQTTLSSLLNVLQSLQSEMITRGELEEMLTDMFNEHMNIDFHIGDEKLARHVNRGNSLLDRRYNPVRS